MEMTAPSLNINVSDEDELKKIIVHETLSKNSSLDISKSERNIVNKTLSQNNSADVSENNIKELRDEDHKESSVTEKVNSYFNIH